MSILDNIRLYEAETEKLKLYVDMDGVLTDFPQAWKNLGHNEDGQTFEDKYGSKAFWDAVDKGGLEFWSEMPWMNDGKKLWEYIKRFNPTILSAPAKTLPNSIKGKEIWIKRELGPDAEFIFERDKQKYANPNAVLIDDYVKKINPWISNDGIGILHTNADKTIAQLKRLGF